VVHRLDPRAKLIALIVIILAVVVATSYTANAILLCSVLTLVLLARLPIRYILSSVIPALPFILILSLFQLLFYGNPTGDAHILLSWGPIRMPSLGEQLDSILQAQASRGVGTKATGRWNLAHNTRRMATLIIPLFIDAYRRSEELTLAMRARCYHGGRGRTHLIDLHFTPADYLATVLALATLATPIVVQYLHLP
jgi:energy-coupling factor transporter transmembrane protein EcfT